MYSLKELKEKEWGSVEYIIGGGILLPGSRLLLAGQYKARKSFMCIQMGLELASGRPFLGTFEVANPVTVLYVNAEIAEEPLVIDRILPVSATYDSVEAEERFFVHNTEYNLQLTGEDMPEWNRIIEESKAQVVIIDPLAEVALGDENNKEAMRRAGSFINRLVSTHGVSVVLVHHIGKEQVYEGKRVKRGFDGIRGSSYWHGWADAMMLLERAGDDYTLDFVLRHANEPDRMALRWDDDIKLFVPQQDKGVSKALVFSLLEDGPIQEKMLTGLIARSAAVSDATIKRRLKEMYDSKEITRTPWPQDKRQNIIAKV